MSTKFRLLCILIVQILTNLYAKLIQVETDLVDTQVASSTGWSNKKISNLLQALADTKFGCLGPYDSTSPSTSKTYGGSYLPHWSLSMDVSAWQVNTWDPPDYVSINIDGVQRDQSHRMSICPLEFFGGTATAADGYKHFHMNISHTASSVTLEVVANLDQGFPDEWLCFNNVRVWIDTCDETCATCDGPAFNQCTSCPTGSTLSGGICQCNGSLFAEEYVCVNCPPGKWGDPNLKKCVPECVNGVNNCVTCLDERHCGACSGGQVVYEGGCIASCPWFYENIGGICEHLEKSFPKGSLIYNGLDGLINKNDEAPFTFTWASSHNLAQSYYVCKNGARMLGGWYVMGTGNTINYDPGIIPYHYRARMKWKVHYVDSWDSEDFILKVDGTTIFTDQKVLSSSTIDYCGLSCFDQNWDYDLTFNHDGNTLSLSFGSNLNEESPNESFGISNLIIIVDECPNQLCTKCDAVRCYTCVAGAFLDTSDICINPCPAGQFGNVATGRCEACSPRCVGCTGSATNCDSCLPERGAATPPNCDCIPGEYDTPPDQTCRQCSYQCTTCQLSANNCLDCAGNRLDTGIPVCDCPVGYYNVAPNPICPQCDFVCATCSGASSNCLTCKGDRIRAPKCQCPDGFFDDSVSTMCLPCDPKCKTCSGNANNCTTCQSNREMPTCNCPSTHFDDGTILCKVCSYQCVTCSGNARTCTSCAGNRLPILPDCPCPPGLNEAGYANCVTCDPKCDQCSLVDKNCINCAANRSQNPPFCSSPLGTYDTNLAACPSCKFKCSSCELQEDNCTACSHISRENVPNCDCKDGYYEQNTIDCGVCPKKCITCKSALECITCSANRQNPPECSCKDGYYQDSNGNCQQCHVNCVKCTGPGPTECDTCSGNRLDYPVCKCPLGTYDNNQPICPPCDVVCTQCSGPSSNQCISCSGNKVYDSILQQCVCPPNTLDLGSGFFCAKCNIFCNGCRGNANNCSQCAQNRISIPSCNSCPDGTYDNGNLVCAQCDASKCSTCSITSTNCITCAAGRVNPPTCQCDIGTFDNGIVCKKCDKMCSSCSKSSTNCLTCIAGRSDAPNCTCDEGTYDDGVNVQCQQCINKCLSCSGINTCNQCRGNRQNPPNCICPDGMFDDNVSENCKECDFKCKSCSGQSNNCTSCRGNRYNFPECSCPPGYYETGEEYCQLCDKQCATCSYSPNNCLTCQGQRIGLPQCTCPSQTYLDPITNQCVGCYQTCFTCTGPNQNSCIQCLPPFVMRDKECKGPIGTYVDIQTNSIQNCLPACVECEFSAHYCIKCDETKNRIFKNNNCFCKDGFIENDQKICVEAIKPNPNKCSAENMAPGIFISNQCDCLPGTYLLPNAGQCIPCLQSNCYSCKIGKCLECEQNYTLSADGSCVQILTDQSAQDTLVIFLFIALGSAITLGFGFFLKTQYNLISVKPFQKLPQVINPQYKKKKITFAPSHLFMEEVV